MIEWIFWLALAAVAVVAALGIFGVIRFEIVAIIECGIAFCFAIATALRPH